MKSNQKSYRNRKPFRRKTGGPKFMYRNRKPFRRKTGGPKFMLGGSKNTKVAFDMPDKNMLAGISNLINLILGKMEKRGGK